MAGVVALVVAVVAVVFGSMGDVSYKIMNGGAKTDILEEHVAQALIELEQSSAELKDDLREVFITSVKEVDVGTKKALVIFVPHRLLQKTHKIQTRLVRELEKKFSGKHVIFIAQRRILRKEKKGRGLLPQKRPVSRTLTSVHQATLEDMVYPSEIVGQRIRYKVDGSRIFKIHLDPRDKQNIEYKTDTFQAVYKKLTGKDIVFEFPIVAA